MKAVKHVCRLVSLLCATGSLALHAEQIQHLSVALPGGFPGMPIITGIKSTNSRVTVTWDGPAGYYQLFEATNLSAPTWRAVGSPNLNRNQTITNLSSHGFFKVLGPSSQFAGAENCVECHQNIYDQESRTAHTKALQTLINIHQDNNPNCLACHTVGFGLPTGFKSAAATPSLAGVQCESCHSPAGPHAANEMDFVKRPRAEIAGQVCGGCHNTSHKPTFDELKSSRHFNVTEDMSPASRINSCGRCHSGSVRLALAGGASAATISATLTNDANVGITCVVCHDPHQNHVWTNVLTRVVETNQLRYPIASTNYFTLSTSATFSNRTDINVCAQCHNDRGAAWESSGRPPHHSPQYNMMLGTVGLLPANGASTNFINSATNSRAGSHGLLVEKQCVSCHMPTRSFVDESHPGMSGHSFRVESYGSCDECHALPELLQDFTALVINTRVSQIKSLLDNWATTKSPLALRTNYGALSWEYTSPGELSSGTAGPSSSQQSLIPPRIKYARFNLYIVKYDGSLGTHNGLHAIALLDAAQAWVQEELK